MHGIIGLYLIVAAVAPYLYGTFMAAGLLLSFAIATLRGCPIPRIAMGWTLALVAIGGTGVLHGLIRGNEGALATVTVFVLEPLLLGLLLPMLFRSETDIARLFRYLDAALIAVAVVGFLIYLQEATGLVAPIGPVLDPRFTALELGSGALRSNYQGFNSLVFLAPYGFVRSMTVGHLLSLSTSRRIILAASALTGTILAGGTILYISTPVAFGLLVLLLGRGGSGGFRTRKILAWLITSLVAIFSLAVVLQTLGVGLSSGVSGSLTDITLEDRSGVRFEQAQRLTEKWSGSPLIGYGAGAELDGYVRDPEAPWRFELSHHLVLVNFGVVGAGVIAAWLWWIVRRLVYGARQGYVHDRSLVAGVCGAVLAATVNPYLFKIEGIWMVFLPFAVAVARRWIRPGVGDEVVR